MLRNDSWSHFVQTLKIPSATTTADCSITIFELDKLTVAIILNGIGSKS